MKSESLALQARAWLKNIPIDDPVERRIAGLLQVVLVGLMVVIILATIILVTIPTFSLQEKLNVVIGDLFGFLVVGLPLSLLRRGYFRASVLSSIGILFITPTLAVTVVFDLSHSGGILFQYTLAILLAGLLVSRRALVLTFGVSAAVVGFAAFRGENAAPQLAMANMEIALNFILFNGLIALFLDQFGITLRAALNAAFEREGELQTEVSSRKRTEETLRESEERYRVLFEDSPLSIWEEDFSPVKQHLEGLRQQGVTDFRSYFKSHPQAAADCAAMVRIVDVNKAALELYHAEKKEDLFKNLGQILSPEALMFFQEELIGIAEGKTKYSWEGVDKTLTGEQIEVSLRWSVAPGYEDSLAKVIVSILDITERRQAEEKIRRQNQRLKALREIDTAILAADSVENIVGAALSHIRELIECQRASLTLIDWATNEALTFDVRTINETAIPSGTRIPLGLFQDMLQSLSKNQPVLINDLRALADPPPQIQSVIRDGLRSLCILPLFSQGRLSGAFSMSSEITDFFDEEKINLGREVANQVAIAITQSRLIEALQRLNADLEQRARERENLIAELTAKNAELEQFTYIVSHDLKSPLVTINGFLGYLEQDAMTGYTDRLKADFQRIARAVEKMQELLKDLLELSRVGRFVNPFVRIPFDELAGEALERVAGQILTHGVTIEVQPDLPAVHGDKHRLVEVIQNLVDNASKYMGGQPRPQIEIGQRGEEDHRPIFFVRDNGIGIASEYHERIFGLFNKLDARTDGTGIGLALARRIIEFHGGRIWVESEEGQGTTFYFTLPGDSPLS